MRTRLFDKYSMKLFIELLEKQDIEVQNNDVIDRTNLGLDKLKLSEIQANEIYSDIIANTDVYNIIEGKGFIIIDSQMDLKTDFTVDEYDGYGDVGYIWNLYTEGAGDGYEWDTTNPSTALTILTTDTVQDPSTVLTIIDGGFIESSYVWDDNNPSSALEVQ